MSRYEKGMDMAKRWFLNRKFLANCCISSGMLVAGDVLQQSYEIFVRRQSVYQYNRTFKMGYAGLATGAYSHHLYDYLDKKYPGKDLKSLTKKVFLDNLSAPLNFAIFFGVMAIVERKRLKEFYHELWTKGIDLYVASSVVYAPVQYANFYFLAPQYRVLFVSMVNLVFDTYATFVAHNDRHDAFETELPDNCHL